MGLHGSRATLALVAIACVLLAGCRTPPPRNAVAAGQASLEERLSQALTEGELTLYLGPPPALCVDAGSGTKLCEWRIGNEQEAWQPIAAAIGAEDRVNVLCELPSDDTPRAPGSCAAYPRRSDRYRYGGSAEDRASAEADAKSRVQSARTLLEISHLLGAAPYHCAWLRDDRRLCTWLVNSQTYGHGTLCVGLGAPTRKQLEFRCELPGDGSPRSLEGCRWR